MNIFYKQGATKAQKWLSFIVLAFCLGPIFWSFTHNFIPIPEIILLSPYLSVLLTTVSFYLYLHFRSKGQLRPSQKWINYSKLKKILLIPSIFVFVSAIFWLNIVLAFPQLLNEIFGSYRFENRLVVKDEHYSRRSCRYRIEFKSEGFIPIWHCISKREFDLMPDSAIEAKLLIKQSMLGYAIKGFRLNNEKH